MKKVKLPRFKIGCDPEFGTDMRIHRSYKMRRVGEFGYDHGGSVGELRPRPGNPAKVVKNLQTMILDAKSKNIISEIYGGGGASIGMSTGGHIHFGTQKFSKKDFGDERQSRNFRYFIKALDHYIGKPLKRHKGGKRNNSGYGNLSDIRGKRYGFEYRTPPSWLTSPELAESVLTVAYTICQLYLHRNYFWARKFEEWSRSRKRLVLCHEDIELLKSFSPKKYQKLHDQYINLIRDREFNLEEAGTIERWQEIKGD